MKKKRLAAGTLALAVSMTVCGCDRLYEMTDKEEAVVVNYSAHVVTKFNKRQSEGIENVAALEKQMELKEKEEQEAKKKQEESKVEKTQTDTTKPKTDAETGPQEEQVQYVSLNQALKLGGIDAVYQGYEVTSSYQESASYIVSANSGNELLILHVNLKNSANKTAKCDILSKMPSFRLTVNDKVSMSADTTILLNDLGTYQNDIPGGSTEKAVLIFQAQKGTLKKIKSMELEVKIGDASSHVQLVSG